MTTPEKPTAYSYIRLSSSQQILGDGQRRQMEAAQDYCKANNLTLSTRTFKDLGVSGFKEGDRPSLSDLHACIDSGTIKAGSVIILEKLDRLSRQGISKTQVMLEEILSKGVIVVSLMDGLRLDSTSLNDLTSVIRIAIAADLGQQESKTKSKRILANKAAMKEKIRAGEVVSMKLPFWLSREGDKYVFNTNKPIVDEIIRLRLNGNSFMSIARNLNEQGMKSPVLGHWTQSTTRQVLRNPNLYGAIQLTVKVQGKYKPDELIQDYFPALVSYQDYLILYGDVVKRAGGHSGINPLAGLVFCSDCGSRMENKSRVNKSGVLVSYFACRKSYVNECSNKTNIKNLHTQVIKNISHLTIEKPVQGIDIDKMLIELDQVDSRIRELTNALIEVNSPLPVSTIMTSLSSLEVIKNDLNAKIREAKSVSPDALQSVLEGVDDPKLFNMDLKKILKRIEVGKSGEFQQVKMIRFDNHFIKWKTGGFGKNSVDSEKSLKLVQELLVEDE